MMINFSLRANCTFEAESVKDACARLSRHFHALSLAGRAPHFLTDGEIKVEPVQPRQSFAQFLSDFAADEAEAGKSGVSNIEQLLHGVKKE